MYDDYYMDDWAIDMYIEESKLGRMNEYRNLHSHSCNYSVIEANQNNEQFRIGDMKS